MLLHADVCCCCVQVSLLVLLFVVCGCRLVLFAVVEGWCLPLGVNVAGCCFGWLPLSLMVFGAGSADVVCRRCAVFVVRRMLSFAVAGVGWCCSICSC